MAKVATHAMAMTGRQRDDEAIRVKGSMQDGLFVGIDSGFRVLNTLYDVRGILNQIYLK
jgi:hypothetical protein